MPINVTLMPISSDYCRRNDFYHPFSLNISTPTILIIQKQSIESANYFLRINRYFFRINSH